MNSEPIKWSSALALLTEDEASELKAIVVSSFRPKPDPAFDADAEAELLVSMAEGFWPAEAVEPDDFYVTIHRGLAEILVSARNVGARPTDVTMDVVLRGLEIQGIQGPNLRDEVAHVMDCRPIAVRPERAARRIRELAWCRRLVAKLGRLRSTLIDAGASAADVTSVIDDFRRECAWQPKEALD